LDGDGGRNGQELGAAKIFTIEAIRPGVAERKQAKSVVGRDQGNAEPGPQMIGIFECFPIRLLVCVGG